MKQGVNMIVGLLAILVTYGVINLLCVGGQKLWHSKDQVRLDEINATLGSQRKEIECMESQLRKRAATVDGLVLNSLRSRHR